MEEVMGRPYVVAEYVFIQSIGLIPFEAYEVYKEDKGGKTQTVTKYRIKGQILFEVKDAQKNRIDNRMDTVVLYDAEDPPKFADIERALQALANEAKERLKKYRKEIAGYDWKE